jgi:hypothetical protein
MGRKTRTILADSHGLESKKKSGGRRGIFLDFPFYGTYQELAYANASPQFSNPRSNVTQFFDRILRTAPTECEAHFSAVIESTCIVLVLASRVPITFTFFPTNFSGARWSLSV